MKVGENGIIVFKMLELDVTTVDKVIFTFSGIEKVEKEYPSEYVTFADGRFFVGLTQQDTIMISRNKRVKVSAEGQICYKNGAVGKTDIVTFMMDETLNTSIIAGNTPSDNVRDIEFHFDGTVLVAGESAIERMTPAKVSQIIEGYEFATPSDVANEVEAYVTTHEEDLKGEKGDNGLSAYQIAVELGFSGTQEEWEESLHGANGNDGNDGNDGKSAYDTAVEGGYEGTEEEFRQNLVLATQVLTREQILDILNGNGGGN